MATDKSKQAERKEKQFQQLKEFLAIRDHLDVEAMKDVIEYARNLLAAQKSKSA